MLHRAGRQVEQVRRLCSTLRGFVEATHFETKFGALLEFATGAIVQRSSRVNFSRHCAVSEKNSIS